MHRTIPLPAAIAAIFEDAALIWARQNPVEAQACLECPAFSVDAFECVVGKNDNSITRMMTWDKYWSRRQWVLKTDHEKALVSHVLSAPLTASHILLSNHRRFFNSRDVNKNVCFVGARAEASLPIQYWHDLFGLLMAADKTLPRPYHQQQYQIHFVGPELTLRPNVSLFVPPTRSPQSTTTMTLQWHTPCKYHELDETTVSSFDVLICLNPGFGHVHLQDSWRLSLPIIFSLQENHPNRHHHHRPSAGVLVTAHSEWDADRDAQFLKNEYGINLRYERNPFASRIRYRDPFCTTKDHLVQPNMYFAIYIPTEDK